MMLSAQNLRKQFANVTAVDDVSFQVARGQIFGLIGPNGAGKTTTIRMLMKILEPDSGSIIMDGRPMGPRDRNRIGYLPEERGLYRKSKLEHVIVYFASLRGMRRKAAIEAAMPWLDRFSLSNSLRRNIEELSKGNQQKVQFVISILHRPDLIVLDEVFSGLDPVNQVVIREALLALRTDNRAIIFSTHQMDLAERLCDELLMIDKGRIVLEGSPADIKGRYGRNAIRLEYLGDGSFLRDLPGVRRADITPNYAELELLDGTETNGILHACLPQLEITSFARIEPSLQAIFIATAGSPASQPDPEAPRSVPPWTATRDPRVRRQFRSMVLLFLAILPVIAFTWPRSTVESIALASIVTAVLGMQVWRFIRMKKRVERERASGEGDLPS